MRTRVRKVLDEVQEILQSEIDDPIEKRDDAADLWNLLSVMRGPDNCSVSWEKKQETTAVFRAAIFPGLNSARFPADYNPMPIDEKLYDLLTPELAEHFGLDYEKDEHFVSHLWYALIALRAEDGMRSWEVKT